VAIENVNKPNLFVFYEFFFAFSPGIRVALSSPALAAADLAEDQDTAALMENPFLADLGAIMQMGAGIKAEDALNDDAAFARLMQSVVDNDASTADTANSTADTAATTAGTSGSGGGGAFSSLGLPAVRLKSEVADNEPVVPQIDGGNGVNPVATGGTGGGGSNIAASAGTASTTADQPPLTGADRVTVGSDDDDSEINAAVGGTQADIRDFIVCLYEGVKRTKTRTKLGLADGVASVQGVDYVFRKAAGEIDFADGAGGDSATKARRGRGKANK
jgi:hypothetical protein